MTEHEFAMWRAVTESSRNKWVEDEIYRLNGRGAIYYTGGEDGVYIRIGQDGKLEAGLYEGAIPHIGEAMFQPKATRQFDSFNDAFTAAMEAGGKQFLVDMFTQEKPLMPQPAIPAVLSAAGEKKMFYRDDDNSLCVGYLRGDFGRRGDEFHHTWFDLSSGRNTPEFKAEFQGVMDALRLEILKDHKSSLEFCVRRPEAALPGDDGHRYGFKLETADRQYFVRCTTAHSDYFYVFVYDKAPVPEQDRPVTEKPSVLEQIREARKAPPTPCKQNDGHSKDGPEL